MEEEIQENQVEQPDLEQAPAAVEEKKANTLLIVILLIAILLIVTGAVYAGMQIGKKQAKVEVEPPFLAVTPQPTEIIDKTVYTEQSRSANWKTYKNKILNYEIKIAASIIIREQAPPNVRPGTTTFYLDKADAAPIIEIGKTEEEYVDKSRKDNIYKIGQHKAYGEFYTDSDKSDKNILVQGILTFENNGSWYSVSLVYFSPSFEEREKIPEDIQQILSTFKFQSKVFINDNPKAKVKYSLIYPESWQIKEHQTGPWGAGYDDSRDVLILQKGDYSINIYQSIVEFQGGRFCIYPKDPECEGFYSGVCDRFDKYSEFLLLGEKIRRARFVSGLSEGHNSSSYYFCQEEDGKFTSLTTFGIITYDVPQDASPAILEKMDSIVGSLKRI